jgi:hypothetical protein
MIIIVVFLDIDKDQTYSVATVWITKQKDKNEKVKNERPTVQLPLELSKKYMMDKPCRVMFFEKSGGILMRFLHYNNKHPDYDDKEQ